MPRRSAAIIAAAIVTALVAVIVVVLVSGGNSSSSTSSSDSRQYVARANAICRATGTKTGPLIKRLTTAAESLISSGGQSASPQVARELGQLYATANDTLAKLRALKPISGGASPIRGFIAPFTIVAAALSKATTAALAGQPQKALLELETVAPSSQLMTSAAKAEGLSACASALAVLP
jgi:hypothetical protein